MPAKKTPNPKATHCKICGIEFALQEKPPTGKKCYLCQKAYIAQYYQDHAEHLSALNKRNQRMTAALKPKKVRTKLSEEELNRRQKVRNDTYNFRKKTKWYIANHPEKFTRKPITPNPDREIYVNNEHFDTPLFYLNFDNIKDCPIEHLSVSFWDAYNSRQEVENEIYVNEKRYQANLEDMRRQNSDYCRPDIQHGTDENGKIIRFYPT